MTDHQSLELRLREAIGRAVARSTFGNRTPGPLPTFQTTLNWASAYRQRRKRWLTHRAKSLSLAVASRSRTPHRWQFMIGAVFPLVRMCAQNTRNSGTQCENRILRILRTIPGHQFFRFGATLPKRPRATAIKSARPRSSSWLQIANSS